MADVAASTPPFSSFSGALVAVTGATGFTGSYLVRRLVALGARVRAVARPSSDLGPFNGLPVEWIRADVYDPDAALRLLEGADYCFHVAAAFRQAGIDDDEYYKVHVESTKLLAERAAAMGSLKRFVHVSTMGVHGHIEEPPGNEESPYAPGDIYQRTKLEAELWIRGFAQERPLPLTVIRPTGIYGPGDRRLLKVFKMAQLPLFPILGRGRCLYHLIHVEDLVEAMLHAALHPSALGEVFLVGNDEAVALETMARIAAEVGGRRLRVIRIPAWPFFGAAAVCEALCKPFGIEPPLYRRRVAFYTKDRSFSTEKIRRILGWKPRWTNEEGIRSTAHWYFDHGWLSRRGTPDSTPSHDRKSADAAAPRL